MTRPPKDILAFLLSAALCGYATWRNLQFVAIAGFIGVLCVVYKPTVVRAAEILLELLGRLTQAKYGGFEVQVGRESVGEILSADAPAWVRSVLGSMTSSHVGLVLAIDKSGSLRVTGGVLKALRGLRGLGLIEHDGPTLAGSSHVQLTALGKDVVLHLRRPSVTSDEGSVLPETGPSTSS
jgi:hypothetical protein